MPLALIAIGIPGSGKTTFLKPFAEKHGLIYINKDDIRAEFLGDVNDQSKNREVWLESERRIAEALENGQGVALDSTHVERWKREELIASLKERGATRVIGAHFDVSTERAMRQNENRERVIGEQSMLWFIRQLTKESPALDEGFDALYTFDELSELEKELER
jgi:predicted kinase